jgi:hypothetical protein
MARAARVASALALVLALGAGREARAGDGVAPETSRTVTIPDPFAIAPSDVLSDDPDRLTRRSYFDDRFWFSGQVNVIFQGHPKFIEAYRGPHSFLDEHENRVSEVVSLYTGIRFLTWTELLVTAEQIGGQGVSSALGLAGFVNMDVVRNPQFGEEPYLARIMLHQTIPLSDELVLNPSLGPFALRSKVPDRRIELYLGKLSLADFMDLSCGADAHFGLLNWGNNTNLAWDYAADTRGYTYAFLAEYVDDLFAARFAEGLEPTVANGLQLDWRFERDHAENLELEVHGATFGERRGKLSVLGWFTHAHMGSYSDALELFFSGNGDGPVPDILQSERARRRTRTKSGVVVEAEQEILAWLRVFARFGIEDDRTESFTYAECGNSVECGFDVRGDLWGRERDRFGASFLSNGLGSSHRRYLEYGGIGTLELGDGGLSYQRETIVETYYTIKLPFGLSAGPLYQHIWNPGYNHARGPIDVYGFRVHLEI